MHRIIGNGGRNNGLFRATATPDCRKWWQQKIIISSLVFLEPSMMVMMVYPCDGKLREEYHILPSSVGTSSALYSMLRCV